MGSIKAALRLGRQALLGRLILGLERLFSKVAVSLPADPALQKEILALLEESPISRKPDLTIDGAADLGPMEGLRASLAALPEDGAFFVAVDMPVLWAPLLRLLSREAARPGKRAAMPCWQGRCEPACAFYRRGLLPDLEAALARGERSLQAIARWPGVEAVVVEDPQVAAELSRSRPFDPALVFFNLNTPADWRALLERRRACLILDDPVMGD